MAGRIGILTGLAFEADLVRKVSKNMNWGADAPEVRCIGMGGAGAGAATQEMADIGVEGVVSFGLAGGLDPALQAGTLLVPRIVLGGTGEPLAVHESWRAQLLGRLGAERTVAEGPLLSGARLITTKEAKQAAFQKSRAQAADMESAKVAVAANDAGLPFLVLRAVADDAATTLPPAAEAMDQRGRLVIAQLIGSLVRRPWQVPALVKLGAKTRSAVSALEDALPKLIAP
ncbi:MAG: purine and other phosphorylase-like protein, family 1 [Pseudomonadota bacterium]